MYQRRRNTNIFLMILRTKAKIKISRVPINKFHIKMNNIMKKTGTEITMLCLIMIIIMLCPINRKKFFYQAMRANIVTKKKYSDYDNINQYHTGEDRQE